MAKIAMAIGEAILIAVVTVISGGSLTWAVILAVASIGLSLLSSLLAPKPVAPQALNQSQNVMIRQAITPWSFAYGCVRKSGPLVFIETSEDNQIMHVVCVLAAHEVDAIGTIFIDDLPIYDEFLDSEGVVNQFQNEWYDVTGTGTGSYLQLRKHLGQPGQVADPVLIAQTSFGSASVGTGIAYIYARFTFRPGLYQGNIPNISAIVYGKKCLDHRDGITRFTTNPILQLRDYLCTPFVGGGLGASSTGDFNDTVNDASANSCEEMVTSPSTVTWQATSSLAATDDIRLLLFPDDADPNNGHPKGDLLPFQLGDQITFGTGAPTGLVTGTPYYVIPYHEKGWKRKGNVPYKFYPSFRVATTLANAVARIQIDLAADWTGNCTVTKTAEPRYPSSGVFDLSQAPLDIIDNFRSSFGGRVFCLGGKWTLLAGIYYAPAITLSEDDCRGPVKIDTRISGRDRFNAVKGQYIGPDKNWQAADYPPVTNATYEAADGDYRIYSPDIPFPFTTRGSTCQRLAKIELERMRQEISVLLPVTLTALRLQGGDTVMLSLNRFGWVNKIFEIVKWELVPESDSSGVPYLGVDLTLRETASAVFDWNSGEEQTIDPAPNTTLPSPFNIAAPGAPTVVEQIYVTRDGSGVKTSAVLTWIAAADAYVVAYQTEWKLSSSSTWNIEAPDEALTHTIFDLTPGIYDFRVIAINHIGRRSDYASTLTVSINGLLAPPTPPQGLTISQLGGLAVIRWTQSPDLDVKIGGYFKFRHSNLLSGATWGASTSIGDVIPGSETVGLMPLKAGTYLAKAVDSSGVESTTATMVSTFGQTALNFTFTTSVTENPAFSGTKTGTVVDGVALELGYASSPFIDTLGFIDTLDWIDGVGGVASSGTYDFANMINMGAVTRVRLISTMTVASFALGDLLDSRTTLMDGWPSFDGVDSGACDCQIWARETSDDPTGTPTYSAFQRLDASEYKAWGFQFQARLSSTDPDFNIAVTAITVTAQQIT